MKTPDLIHVEETAGTGARFVSEQFLGIRDGLGISDTAAAVLVLADMLREVGHDDCATRLAQCITDLSR